jgi:hypothetical protein
MAIDPKDLTIDYRKIQSMPFRDRKALVYSSFADQVNSALTPSQRANLFPNYYVKSATSGATPGAGGDPNLSKADYLNRARNGGVSNSDYNRVSGRPEDRGPPQITASEFRAVESNPFLAGYVDKAGRKEKNNVIGGSYQHENARAAILVNKFVKAGLSRNAALSVVANNMQESGANLNTTIQGDKNLSSPSQGIAQWRAERLSALKEFAKRENRDWADLETQADFQILEFKTKKPALPTQKNPRGRGNVNTKDENNFITSLNNAKTEQEREKILRENYEVGIYDSENYYAYLENLKKGKFVDEAVADQTTTPDGMAVVQQVASETPSASEIRGPDVVTGDSLVAEEQSRLAGVRKQAITPELKEVLQYAAEDAGVRVEVFSGGQADITQGGPRTGTERHDLGHAADIKLQVQNPDGSYRYLSSKNEADRQIMAKFITTSRKMGATGIGSGAGYMGESGIHVGTVVRPDIDYSSKPYGAPAGNEGVWQSDTWAQKAFIEGQKQAEEFQKSGGMATFREDREKNLAEKQTSNSKEASAESIQPPSSVVIVEKSGAELLPESHPFSMTKEKKERIIAAQSQATTSPVATATPAAGLTTPSVTTAAPVEGATTPSVTTASTPTKPQSDTYPTKTMAQGGIIPKSADTQIVQRNMSGDIISATKVGENENERMSIEPISKMSADALTVGSYNPVDEGMIDSKSQSAPEDKKVSMTSRSVAQPRLSSDPYSNIQGNIKPMSPTARAAMMAARDLSTQRRGYSL